MLTTQSGVSTKLTFMLESHDMARDKKSGKDQVKSKHFCIEGICTIQLLKKGKVYYGQIDAENHLEAEVATCV